MTSIDLAIEVDIKRLTNSRQPGRHADRVPRRFGGRLVFFVEFSATTGMFDRPVFACPLQHLSSADAENAFDPLKYQWELGGPPDRT